MPLTEDEALELAELEQQIKMAEGIETDSPDPERSELLSLGKERELKRAEAAKTSFERGADVADRFAQGSAELAVDVPISMLQAASFEFGDELIGGTAAAFKRAAGDSRPVGEIYEEARDAIRNIVSGARDRSPMGTFIMDFVAPNPFGVISSTGTKLSKLKKTKKIGRAVRRAGEMQKQSKFIDPALQGSVAGVGASEELGKDTGTGILIGGGLGLLGAGLIEGGKIGFDKAAALEARFLGFNPKSSKNMTAVGQDFIGKVSENLDELNNKGAFFKETRFDPEQNAFVFPNRILARSPKKDKGFRRILSKKANKMELESKFRDANDVINKRIDDIIKKDSPELFDVEGASDAPRQRDFFGAEDKDAFMDIEGGSGVYGRGTFEEFDDNRLKTILDDRDGILGPDTAEVNDMLGRESSILWQSLTRGRGKFTVADLQREKKRLYKELADVYGKQQNPTSEAVITQNFKREMARMYKDMINDITTSGDPMVRLPEGQPEEIFQLLLAERRADARGSEIAQLNKTAEEILEFKRDLSQENQGIFFDSPGDDLRGTPSIRSIGLLESVGEKIATPTRLTRAEIVRQYDSLPKFMKIPDTLKGKVSPSEWIKTFFMTQEGIEGIGRAFGARVTDELVGDNTERRKQSRKQRQLERLQNRSKK